MISREYSEFLREEIPSKMSLYENLCKLSGKILPLPTWSNLEKTYREAIEFSHLNISPKEAFAFALLSAILIIIIPSAIAFFLGVFTSVFLISSLFALLSFFYFYYYPNHYATVFIIKASSEMTLSIIYMTISMRITQNLENAVKFAADNLTGPLGFDLKKVLWNVYMRKYNSIDESLDWFIKKWKKDNEEFTEALYLIKNSTHESQQRLEQTLDESVSVILEGTKERMKHYAQELRTPVNVINSMGILLPIIGLVFFPIIGIFLPTLVQPAFLVVGYDILLPIGVFWMMQTYLEKRPYTFHQPDISRHPMFLREKFFNRIFIISLAIATGLIAFSSYEVAISGKIFGFDLLVYSLLVTGGLGFSIVFYAIFSVRNKLKIRNEIITIENEFSEALAELSSQFGRGIPIEKVFKFIAPKMKNLNIAKLFELIIYNIETFGMTFEQAIFDKDHGALRQYPSSMIEAVMKAIVQISRRGMVEVAKASRSISNYLKDVHSVEESLKEILSEVTSTMEIQALLLAPLTSGIVVSLTAMVMQILVVFGESVQKIQQSLAVSGAPGNVGSFVFGSIIDLNRMIPVHTFQIIVGIYMLEIIGMLAIFLSTINNGEENLMKKYTVGRFLLLGTAMYILVVIFVYLGFSTVVPIADIIRSGGLV